MTRRILLLIFALVCASPLFSQVKPDAPAALPTSLMGEWAGVLEYRDYSEPATSTKRVQLPTWLTISPSADGLVFRYIYDDGPNKVLDERETVVIDAQTATYTEIEKDASKHSYAVAGLDKLKDGRGELLLTGTGIDNDKPAELRITMTVRRNLLIILQEARAAKPDEAFAFRHRFVFTRTPAPKPTATR